MSQGWKGFCCPTPTSSPTVFEGPWAGDKAPAPPRAAPAARCHCWGLEKEPGGVGAPRCSQPGRRQQVTQRRELEWCNSLTGPPEKCTPGELELSCLCQGSSNQGSAPCWHGDGSCVPSQSSDSSPVPRKVPGAGGSGEEQLKPTQRPPESRCPPPAAPQAG